MKNLVTLMAAGILSISATFVTPSIGRTEEPPTVVARGYYRDFGPYYHLYVAENEARFWEIRGHAVRIVGHEHHWHVLVWVRD